MKNLLTGAIIEKAFINSARVEEISLVRKPMQYLYKDGENYAFMDPKTYDQVSLDEVIHVVISMCMVHSLHP
jgi:elongation factor P